MEIISFESYRTLVQWVAKNYTETKERKNMLEDGVSNRIVFGSYFIRRKIRNLT